MTSFNKPNKIQSHNLKQINLNQNISLFIYKIMTNIRKQKSQILDEDSEYIDLFKQSGIELDSLTEKIQLHREVVSAKWSGFIRDLEPSRLGQDFSMSISNLNEDK